MTRRWMIAGRHLAHIMVLGLVAVCLASPAVAAVVAIPTATTTLTDTVAARSGVTYTFGQYQEAANRLVVGVDVTFPAGTVLTAATVPPALGTWTRSGQTISITFPAPIPTLTPISISIDNVTNRSNAGTFTDIQLVFHTTNNGGKQPATTALTAGSYTIVPAPYLSMTITTPDAGQTVNFGSIDPGVTTGPKQVSVAVTSSAPYTLTCVVGGDTTALGLTPSPPATRTGTAGSATFTDSFTLKPPWTTDPEIPLTATLTYTVTQ